MDPLPQLVQGQIVTVYLIDKRVHTGLVTDSSDTWLSLNSDHARLINVSHIIEIVFGEEKTSGHSLLPKPRSKDAPVTVSAKTPARPWNDDDLKILADAFLENETDTALAERFHRSRNQITVLRQGFECARGNLVDDSISAVARTWIARWRKVLAG